MLCNTLIQDVKTFLSPSVRDLLVDSREAHLTTPSHNFVTPHLTFNWACLSSYLDALSVSKDANQQIYLKPCQKLWSVFMECGRKVQDCKAIPLEFWQWTNCQSDITFCYTQLQSSADCITPLMTSLLLSSIFEHSAGNVYQLKEKNVPFLLRDLLSSNELSSIFGDLPMLVAKTLLGTPLTFNVRNVCWHGFPAPEEIYPEIAATLMVLITSFGELLQIKTIVSIPFRPKMGMDAWTPFLPAFESLKFPQLNVHFSEVMKFLRKCHFIPHTHRLYWTSALNYLHCNSYGECLIMLLPALEHTLRCAFCAVNSCPNRLLLADQHVLYTTMDEILGQHCTKSEGIKEENRLPFYLGRKVTEMLQDMFSSIGGPRIRDKLSHGECDLRQIPELVSNHLFCISLLVLLKLEAPSEFKLATQLMTVEENYKAKFHSSTILKNQATAILEKLKAFHLYKKSNEGTTNIISPEILNLQSSLLVYSSKFRSFSNDNLQKLIDCYLKEPVITLYRTKSDLSMIAVLRKIISALKEACDNSLAALDIRQNCLSQHALRSRQRISYFRMLEFIPSFEVMVRCVTLIVLIQLLALPNIIVHLKFMKIVQQYADNLSSLSSLDKNRWAEIRQKTDEFCHQCIQLIGLEPEQTSNLG